MRVKKFKWNILTKYFLNIKFQIQIWLPHTIFFEAGITMVYKWENWLNVNIRMLPRYSSSEVDPEWSRV